MAACRSTSRSRSSTTAPAGSWRRACRPCSTTSPALDAACSCSTTRRATTCPRSPRAHPDGRVRRPPSATSASAPATTCSPRGTTRARCCSSTPTRELVEPRTVARLLRGARRRRRGGRPAARVGGGRRSTRATTASCTASARGVAQAAGDSYYRRREAPADVAWVSGAACLVDRASVRRGRAASTPSSSCSRRRRTCSCGSAARGGRVRYLPTVRVRHDGGVVASRDEHLRRLGGAVRRQARRRARRG